MTRRLLFALLAVTLVFRVWLAAAFPMTGDEAYFVFWGWHPDWGFYDHPPMVGWWLTALLQLGSSELWLRLPALVQPVLLAWAVHAALPALAPGISDERRLWIVLLIVLAPVNVWNVFITTDTPLIYFSVLSGLCWLRAGVAERPLRWYLASGVLLAGAVLSKYFAAILGFAYLVDALRRRQRAAWLGLVIAYACCVPALALMAWWNSTVCWPNFMFNFINRHANVAATATTPLLYLVTLLYMLTPPALWLAWKHRRTDAERGTPFALSLSKGERASIVRQAHHSARTESEPQALAVLAWLPFALFGLLSFAKPVGLHWLLSFIPFALIWLALRLPGETLRKLGLFFASFAVLHVALVLIGSRLPLETWQRSKLYDGIVLTFESQALLKEVQAYAEPDWVLAMDGYSNAATLGYNARRHIVVFGEGSSYARHDDLVTDFRALAGRNILILTKAEPAVANYQPYFRRIAIDNFEVRGARFWRVKGEGFDYAAYRDGVLTAVRKKYYALPRWLPQNGCYLCDQYFPGETCCR